MSYNKDFGAGGEKLALQYLEKKGYNILENNYRTRRGEIDIIAQNCGVTVFVEVKTRASFKHGTPGMSITPAKISALLSVVRSYVMENSLEQSPLRIDVIEIVRTNEVAQINHIENAVQGDIYE